MGWFGIRDSLIERGEFQQAALRLALSAFLCASEI